MLRLDKCDGLDPSERLAEEPLLSRNSLGRDFARGAVPSGDDVPLGGRLANLSIGAFKVVDAFFFSFEGSRASDDVESLASISRLPSLPDGICDTFDLAFAVCSFDSPLTNVSSQPLLVSKPVLGFDSTGATFLFFSGRFALTCMASSSDDWMSNIDRFDISAGDETGELVAVDDAGLVTFVSAMEM